MRAPKKTIVTIADSGEVGDIFYSSAKTPKDQQRVRNYLKTMLEQPKLVVRLLTNEERKLVQRLKNERGWDPDILALVGILESIEPRWNEALNNINVLDETDRLLKKASISNVVYDVFDSGKVGVCRRTGLFGVGMSLREAFRHVQIVDAKALRHAERGNDPEE